MANQFRAITVSKNIKLPAISTDIPEREYTFMAFIREYVLEAKELRTDDNLVHYFEWDDVVSKFLDDTNKQVERPETFTRETFLQREEDVNNIRIGKSFNISEDAFNVGVLVAKKSLDEVLEKKMINNQFVSQMPAQYGPKVLRHYFSFKQSKLVE
jgi:hypothetical protein